MEGLTVLFSEKTSFYLAFLLPPLMGALIGYVTNRVAIRMLFRPLREWKILGVKVPMTPGVIPAKRGALAKNIGEMVGAHLLTHKEVGEALESDQFQRHLHSIIQERVGGFINRDLGPVSTLIPNKYKGFIDNFTRMVSLNVYLNIKGYVDSEAFESLISKF